MDEKEAIKELGDHQKQDFIKRICIHLVAFAFFLNLQMTLPEIAIFPVTIF